MPPGLTVSRFSGRVGSGGNGRQLASLDSLQAVARLFDVSVDDLCPPTTSSCSRATSAARRRAAAACCRSVCSTCWPSCSRSFRYTAWTTARSMRMANLADYGVRGFRRVVRRHGGSRRLAHVRGCGGDLAGSCGLAPRSIVALVGFAVQALAVVLFASTMQPYATTLMFALLLAKVVVGYRILRS
ncbi:MAG: XRE family transcriptional regulator [Eggerthella lenta]